MLFTDESNYRPNGETAHEGFYACLGLSDVLAQEVANAYAAGTGPGTPDATGTLQAGTIRPGRVLELATDGTWILGTSPLVNAALPKQLWFAHEGDIDLTGRLVGKLTALRGFARFKTSSFTGSSFAVGAPLYANAGNFVLKALADNRQVVGYVGPDGLRDGMLDVMFEPAAWG